MAGSPQPTHQSLSLARIQQRQRLFSRIIREKPEKRLAFRAISWQSTVHEISSNSPRGT